MNVVPHIKLIKLIFFIYHLDFPILSLGWFDLDSQSFSK